MVIVDTTVWVDYLKGASTPQIEWLELEMGRQRLGGNTQPCLHGTIGSRCAQPHPETSRPSASSAPLREKFSG